MPGTAEQRWQDFITVWKQTFISCCTGLFEKLSGLDNLRKQYKQLAPSDQPEKFLGQVLDYLQIKYQITPDHKNRIPVSGPLIIVANHPHGALDGLVLAHLLLQIRPDVRILANRMLETVAGMQPLLFGCDPFRRNHAQNQTAVRQSLRWLKSGGTLLIFPAGEVSHFQPRYGRIIDPRWHDTAGRLAIMSGATVVPMFIHGHNSILFQAAGILNPFLRTLMLPRELLNQTGREIAIKSGKPILHHKLNRIESDQGITHYLRLSAYVLGDAGHKSAMQVIEFPKYQQQQTIIGCTPEDLQKSEIRHLPSVQRLSGSGKMEVYYARATQIPWLLQEIGRLREITFRAAGEGTGKAVDIDLYDAYYLHLFVWNVEKAEIVGAYRLGLADEILNRYGKRGLYTHSLFKYRSHVLRQINPAIELGRSFIRHEYQGSYLALNLLWQGIAAFIVQRKRYPVLFGPVSISNEYDHLSRKFMIDCLQLNQKETRWASGIKARRPFRSQGRSYWNNDDLSLFNDAGLISDFVSQLENDNKGLPVLLRQYLKLGGKFLCFNVDDEFSNVVDGLIMVDLRKTSRRALEKYMGVEQTSGFLLYHGLTETALRDVS